MSNLINIIKNPRITEKASYLLEGNVYTFDVVSDAGKQEVAKAVFEIYKVKPVKVNIVNGADKKVRIRGWIKGTKNGGRKAYVYLKEGDKIDFI